MKGTGIFFREKKEALWQDSAKWKLLLPICAMLSVCVAALTLGVISMLQFTLPEMTFTQQPGSWELCELTYNEKEQVFSLENRQMVELSPDTGAPMAGTSFYGSYSQLDKCDPDLFVEKKQEENGQSLVYSGLVYYSGCFYLAGEGADGWYLTYWDGSFPASSQQPVPLREFCRQAFWFHLYELSGGNGLFSAF